MKIGGKDYSKSEVIGRIGNAGQVGGLRRFKLQEGLESESEIIQLDTGSGLKVWISPSKCMDIVQAEYCGSSLCWQGNNGVVNPAYYNEDGAAWMGSYSSGLLTTCGMSNVGSPCEDEGVSYGLHGHAHNIPAREVGTRTYWEADECKVEVSGVISETMMFGKRFVLTRKISATLGKNKIEIYDTIENLSGYREPLLILYHCNFGFPLLADKSVVSLPSTVWEPREPDLGAPPAVWSEPVAGYQEKVYYYSDIQTKEGIATAVITNPEFPVGGSSSAVSLKMSWDTSNLPELVQWYMPGYSTHVMGIEPANCRVKGRADERSCGRLEYLEALQVKDFRLSFEVVPG